jgi:hypothetical protein
MKKLFLIQLLVFYAFLTYAQNYYVIRVEGKVMSNENLLKTGDKLTTDSNIRFSSLQDRLYLLSPDKGYFLLSPDKQPGQNSRSWVVALKNAAIPQNKFYNTASRSTGDSVKFNDVYDLMGFFREKVTLIGETRFYFNPGKILLDKSNYFEFSNLSFEAPVNFLTCIPGKDFFTLSANVPDSCQQNKIEMSYSQNGKKKEIGTFTLIVRDKKDIVKELALFFLPQESSDPAVIYFEQVLPYVAEVYGNTDLQTIRSIIGNDLKISF